MPRRSRIDAPGALHHIIVRGIERKTIFKDDADRDNFLERLQNILTDSNASCFAWALIPNQGSGRSLVYKLTGRLNYGVAFTLWAKTDTFREETKMGSNLRLTLIVNYSKFKGA
jgi:hypothetical protein